MEMETVCQQSLISYSPEETCWVQIFAFTVKQVRFSNLMYVRQGERSQFTRSDRNHCARGGAVMLKKTGCHRVLVEPNAQRQDGSFSARQYLGQCANSPIGNNNVGVDENDPSIGLICRSDSSSVAVRLDEVLIGCLIHLLPNRMEKYGEATPQKFEGS